VLNGIEVWPRVDFVAYDSIVQCFEVLWRWSDNPPISVAG